MKLRINMTGNHDRNKNIFRGTLSSNNYKPTLLEGDPLQKGVTKSVRRIRYE